MTVEYDGTEYRGWQVQPHGATVQGTLERAIATILRHPVRVEAAGRTDAGVHARGQVAAFSTEVTPDLVALERSVNALAGAAIAVRDLRSVADDFDPRRHATSRTYEYRIDNAVAASPFTRRYAWHVPVGLDVDAMARAASELVGEHDFSSFQAADCDAENPVRRVTESVLARDGSEIRYRVSATAFLRHMVRNVVGTLVETGTGKRVPDAFRDLLRARDRRLAGPTAPPHGLTLLCVNYDADRVGSSGV